MTFLWIRVFSTSVLLTFLGQIIVRAEDCPVSCRMFMNIPGLYSPGASSTLILAVVADKNVSRHCQMYPGWQIHFWLTTTVLDSAGFPLGVFKISLTFISSSGYFGSLIWRGQVISALWLFPKYFESENKLSTEMRQRGIYPYSTRLDT